MRQSIILAFLIIIAGFSACSDDDKVILTPNISGIEEAYTILEGAKLELNPIIENDENTTYVWQLNAEDVAKTKNYVFNESKPGDYKLVLKVMNESNVVTEIGTIITVGQKDFTFEGVSYRLISLELPDYVRENGSIEWEVLSNTSELYRFSQMTIKGKEGQEKEENLFIAAEPGDYLLQMTSGDIKGEVKIVVKDNENELSAYINNVFDYSPAPGQYVNKIPKYEEGDTHEDMVAKAAANIVGEDGKFITLGGWGGNVTFGFDHTIINVAGKQDFRIEGNGFTNSSEPGIVMVSFDANGNGEPDDEWYEIEGSANFTAENEVWYESALESGNDVNTYRDFEMTYFKPQVEEEKPLKEYIRWTNNKGEEGYKEKNNYHKQSYYPQWIKDDKITFSGIRLAQSGVDQSGQGTYFVLKSFKYGYVDNHSNRDDKSTINIDWAVDKEGNKANLPGIDFVKVYTGVDQENGWLGENSTETGKGMDLHILSVSIDSLEE